ncbi:CDP-alcohol phosphatidyltransferase family protein [bacterium]|nr:CDP-alcohol phosphatidyltransferase family protein [bacterium]
MRVWTVPNVLSVLRLVLLYPIFYYLIHQRPWIAVAFMFAGVMSDMLDGYIARRFNQQSDLGRILDPLIDKINVIAVAGYLTLSAHYNFPLWMFIFLILRELIVIVGGMAVMRGQKIVMESTVPGKRSAFFTGLSLPLYAVNLQPWALIVLLFGLILTIYSTSIYYQRYRKHLRQAAPAGNIDQEGAL